MHYIRIWSSRTGNVLHSSRESAFACLLFDKVEEVQHSIVIPSDSHSGINYPPFANADGFETTDCLECLQILDILIYGRRVCFRIWSSREENVLHTSVNQLLYSCRHQSSAYSFFLITVFYVPPTCSTYLLCFSLSQQRRIYQNDGYMRLLLVTCTLNSQIYF